MLCVAEIESNCGVSEPFQLGSEDHIKGVILVLVLSSRSQRKLGLTSRPERRCGCGSIRKPRRQLNSRHSSTLTNKGVVVCPGSPQRSRLHLPKTKGTGTMAGPPNSL